jgi:hypothetical protein
MHIPAHLKQISYTTTTKIHHDTHPHTCPHVTHKTSTTPVTPTGLIIPSSALTITIVDHMHKTIHFSHRHLLMHSPTHNPHFKSLSSQQTTHQTYYYRNLKTSEFLFYFIFFYIRVHSHNYDFTHIFTHAHHRPNT